MANNRRRSKKTAAAPLTGLEAWAKGDSVKVPFFGVDRHSKTNRFNLPAPPPYRKIAFIPDTHIPNHDLAAWELMLEALRAFNPDTVIILGDFADFEPVSAHPRKPRSEQFLHSDLNPIMQGLSGLSGLKASRLVYVMGNHEHRLERYIAKNAPALDGLFSYESWLKGQGWEVVPYLSTFKLGKLNITHDTGTAGINAHRDAAAAHMGSTIIGHCLPLDYEVLTPTGFVSLGKINIGDTVYSYSDGAIVETSVEDKVDWLYNGTLINFDHHMISQRMTDEHHIFTKDGRYIPVRQALAELSTSDLVSSWEPVNAPEFDIPDEWLKLIVAYCADGQQASAGSVRFHLKKERKRQRLEALWRAVGGTLEWTPGWNGAFKTKGLDRPTQQRLVALAPEKRLPDWVVQLSRRQRQIFLDELELWDGSVIQHEGRDAGHRQFCSFKPVEIDLVQVVLAQHGIRSRLHKDKTVVSYCIDTDRASQGSERKLAYYADAQAVEQLRVGCLSTAHRNFFVRTHTGAIELTGNTHRLAYEVRGKVDGTPYLAAMFGWLGDPAKITYLHNARAAHWVHGFGIGYELESGVVHVQPVPIIDGKCMIEGRVYSSGPVKHSE